MAQSEEGTASPSAAGGGANRLEDGFVPVPKDEPISPAPVRAEEDRLTLRLAREICRPMF